MFSRELLETDGQIIEFREEILTGLRCRISTSRGERSLNSPGIFEPLDENHTCPFCPDRINKETPCFEDGGRIHVGESVTFPNSFPFGRNHIVTVVTREHLPEEITESQIRDSLTGQYLALVDKGGFATINWNFLPSAGASMIHPHIQGLADENPTYLTSLYIEGSRRYLKKYGENYWPSLVESERGSERYLFGDEITWAASPVPLGEKEIRGYLPVCSFDEFYDFIPLAAKGLKKVIRIYERAGNRAFNMAIKFGRTGDEEYFCSFISMIARINPNPMCFSDSAFMERLHLEPVIMTVPEEIRRSGKLSDKY